MKTSSWSKKVGGQVEKEKRGMGRRLKCIEWWKEVSEPSVSYQSKPLARAICPTHRNPLGGEGKKKRSRYQKTKKMGVRKTMREWESPNSGLESGSIHHCLWPWSATSMWPWKYYPKYYPNNNTKCFPSLYLHYIYFTYILTVDHEAVCCSHSQYKWWVLSCFHACPELSGSCGAAVLVPYNDVVSIQVCRQESPQDIGGD